MNSSYKNSLSFTSDVKKINQDYHELYKRPIPIDSINKYWGVDAVFLKHDDTLQKQSYDQANKNFWSFVEQNMGMNAGMTMNSQSFSNVTNNTGFSQTNFSQSNMNKITGLSYQEARTRASMK